MCIGSLAKRASARNAPAIRWPICPSNAARRDVQTETLSPAELLAAGYKALAAALSPLGMARFLRQFEPGNGDYTRERREWLRDQSVHSVTARIRARKKIGRAHV